MIIFKYHFNLKFVFM